MKLPLGEIKWPVQAQADDRNESTMFQNLTLSTLSVTKSWCLMLVLKQSEHNKHADLVWWLLHNFSLDNSFQSPFNG